MKKKLMSISCAGLLLCSSGAMASAEIIKVNNETQPQTISPDIPHHIHVWREYVSEGRHYYKCDVCGIYMEDAEF